MTPATTPHRSALVSGLAAGAVGTTVLNAVTYADMAVRGRDASGMPGAVVDALADRLGLRIGGSRTEAANRREAYAALSGTVAGVGVGALVGVLRRAGLRLPAGVGGVLTGAAAMAATDLPAAALGVTDLRDWTAQDWLSDALPHLAYGVTTHWTLRQLEPSPPRGSTAVVDRPVPASAGLLVRAALLGVAVGGRSSLGLAAPALTGSSVAAAVGGLVALGGEVVVDKQPGTPSRLSAGGLPVRLLAGAGGAAVLAGRAGSRRFLPALAGAAGAAAGSVAGASWRASAGQRVPDWQSAVAEDVVAIGLGLLAARR
ncbi:hypothetical protein [Kineococcus rubinsiae]|uniref:hypothetical protein n=1 Tax=Kineococcus rubinsiae TaxID=2609562 RepID=UPI00143034AD|nr:hypothetical protein [Kineococcus rubinsiae]NIZ92065.1 hypothetical protein [Kineococcus rubinsiae]